MPRYQSNADTYYRPIEADRREAHKTATLYWQFPLAWSILLGAGSAFLAWRVAVAWDNPTSLNIATAISAIFPLAYLLFYLTWWLRELMKLNRDAKPQETYNPNPGLRRDWVRTVTPNQDQHRAVFLHAEDSQLQAIARHIQAGRSFNVTELAPYFGGNRAAVQTFYGDLASTKPPMGEWVNANDHRAGFRLLQEGVDHLYAKLPPTPPQASAAPVYGRNPLYIQDMGSKEDE